MTAQKFGGGAVVKKKIRKSKNGLRAAASSSSSLCSFEESIENLKVGHRPEIINHKIGF